MVDSSQNLMQEEKSVFLLIFFPFLTPFLTLENAHFFSSLVLLRAFTFLSRFPRQSTSSLLHSGSNLTFFPSLLTFLEHICSINLEIYYMRSQVLLEGNRLYIYKTIRYLYKFENIKCRKSLFLYQQISPWQQKIT